MQTATGKTKEQHAPSLLNEKQLATNQCNELPNAQVGARGFEPPTSASRKHLELLPSSRKTPHFLVYLRHSVPSIHFITNQSNAIETSTSYPDGYAYRISLEFYVVT